MSDSASNVLRNARKQIEDHEAGWLATLREEVPSYDPDEGYADDHEVWRMDEVQRDQAFAAQELLRDLLTEFRKVAA
ncbi:hypothetical protein [Streptomyces sp. NPDC018045]|uniref:hypothetical protein n=1 Tax=Streptomyces sp. NPDC018045 TaxID=3365037 RepID=UPI0037B88BCD